MKGEGIIKLTKQLHSNHNDKAVQSIKDTCPRINQGVKRCLSTKNSVWPWRREEIYDRILRVH